jgi:U32 family peptidase
MTKKIGDVVHYFNEINVAILKLEKPLKVGEEVNIKGHTTDFSQKVSEMQYDHKPIESGKKGQEVGIKVEEYARVGDEVFAIE